MSEPRQALSALPSEDKGAIAVTELPWLHRQVGPIDLRYRPHSYAARDIGILAARFASALATVTDTLALDPAGVPAIVAYVVTAPPSDPATDASVHQHGGGPLILTVAHAPEGPCVVPEVDLLRLLLNHQLGPVPRSARFWDEGLVGYVAGQTGRSPYYAQASERCHRLLDDGALPPAQELAAQAQTRVSSMVMTAAAALAAYLIRRFGLGRYRSLLRTARRLGDGLDASFLATYHRSLSVVDRDWRRSLDQATRARQMSSASTVRRLLPLARGYWPTGLAILIYTTLTIGFSLILPLAFRFLIDNVLTHRPLQQALPLVGPAGHVITGRAEQLRVLLGLMAALGTLYLLYAAARLRQVTLVNRAGESFVLDLRRQMLAAVVRLPASYFARTTTADVNQRILYDTASIQQAIAGALVPLVSSVLAVAMNAAVLIALEPRLSLVVLLGLPPLGLLYRLRRRALRMAARERTRRVSSLAAGVTEITTLQAFIKIYRAASYMLGRLGRQLDVHRHLNVAYAQESSALGQSATLIMHLLQVAVLLVGGYIIVASDGNDLAAGGLAAFYVLLGQIFGPVSQVAAARQGLTDAGAAVERVAQVLAEQPEQDAPDAVHVGPLADEIRFESVSFAYTPNGPTVLHELTLRIPAGSTVAFVGPTGAGKSSVVGLLPRLYLPTAGRIVWDTTDIQSASLSSLRQHVALVPQDALLLSTTIYENIRFGLDDATEADVRRAATLAHADRFISALTEGYDTVVRERGGGLSGGERQRIALARALLRDPSLLIVDEATSALDATTQRAVQDGLRERLHAGQPPRTIVKIAHRLETVADADIIFVMDDGRLVEQGRHDELIRQHGMYAQLLADQLGTLEATPPFMQGADMIPPVRWLIRFSPFAELMGRDLEAIGAALVRLERPAGMEIYEQGGAPDAVYVLGNGRIELFATDDMGEQHVVNTVGPSQVLALADFVHQTPHRTGARTLTDVVIFELTRASFDTALAMIRAARDGQAPPDDELAGDGIALGGLLGGGVAHEA